MHIPNIIKPSRIHGRPTVILIAPQGSGKGAYASAIADKCHCSHTVNGEAEVPAEGVPLDAALVLFDAGAEPTGGDITIICHTQAGFDALLVALGIPLTPCRPLSSNLFQNRLMGQVQP